MDATALATPLAAFTAGLVTSVHCAAMCGPLGCALLGGRGAAAGEVRRSAALYHCARAGSYALCGGVLGTIGTSAAGLFGASASRALPWAFALLFVCIAFGWDRYVPRPAFVSRLLLRLDFRNRGRRNAAALLGLLTPFLPCGPLYLALGVALVSGSFLAGATLMAAFAAGTVPFYALAQAGTWRIQARLSPEQMQWTRRALALVSALIVGGRALFNDSTLLEPVKCLLCR